MKIGIITPAPPRSHYGNRVTATRWARILRRLGHRVALTQAYRDEAYDLLVALHAKRSFPSARRFHHQYPSRALIVALTGTDLYRDLPRRRSAQRSLEMATRIVALQPGARAPLPRPLRPKLRVIYQSARPPRGKASHRSRPGSGRAFDVCVIGHLRPVKDPFRAAFAARRLPPSSRVRVLHLGGAIDPSLAERARREMTANPRYHWLGDQPRRRVWQILRRSALLVLSSKLEGGANVISEALVARVPVLASRIAGSCGILGKSYPGYFEVGDTEALAGLLGRAETDRTFLAALRSRCAALAPLFAPAREAAAWRSLLKEIEPHKLSPTPNPCLTAAPASTPRSPAGWLAPARRA